MARVFHAELWGPREGKDGKGGKYEWLFEQDVEKTPWKELQPQSPSYLFVPQDTGLRAEYEKGWKVTEIFPVNVLGFQTHRDAFAIDFDRDTLRRRIEDMRDPGVSDADFSAKNLVQDSVGWKLALMRRRLQASDNWEAPIVRCVYRPFDWRWCYFNEIATDRPRRELIEHVAGKPNLCLNAVRQTRSATWQHAVVSNAPAPAVFVELKDGSNVFPLYCYEHCSMGEKEQPSRSANFSGAFLRAIEASMGPLQVGQAFLPGEQGKEKLQVEDRNVRPTMSPEDVLHYIYAIFYCPTYRSRYSEFLKADFPRVPLTSDKALFRALCEKGGDLVSLHLLESPLLSTVITRFPVPGDHLVEKGYPRFTAPDRVHINAKQYFEGVSEDVWAFHVGGYQVAHKWLKDRQGRQLSYDDLTHYQKTITALHHTIRVMKEIDALIPKWPLE